MLIAPGIHLKTFHFGEHVGSIYVSNDSSLDGVVTSVVSCFGQDPSQFIAKLNEDDVYVISEKIHHFPKSLEEWKEEHPGYIFGECHRELRYRNCDALIPDLEYFENNGTCHFCFPATYLKAKNTPKISKCFSAREGSFYVDSKTGKSGFIPSGVDFITLEQLENLMNRIDVNDTNVRMLFQSENYNVEDEIVLINIPYALYWKLVNLRPPAADSPKKKKGGDQRPKGVDSRPSAANPSKKKKKDEESRRPKGEELRRPKAANPPKKPAPTREELKLLSEITKRNHENAISEMRDELRKSAGRVAKNEFVIASNTGRSEYDLKNIEPLIMEDEDDSLSSDTVSSSE